MKYVLPAIIFTFSLLCFPIDGLGQDEDRPVRVETELVSINVTVIDGSGKPVARLSQGQFEIYDDRVKQDIELFSARAAGVTYGIVYDMHPTTEQRTNAVLNGLREFTKALPSADEHFFVVFNERGSWSLDFVPDSEQLKALLERPEKREPRSLYDALFSAAEKLRQTKNLKKTLLVITDGADHNSRKNFNELRNELKKFDVQVYAIVLDETLNRFDGYIDVTRRDETPRTLSDASPNDRAALSSITLRTGGATFPSSLDDQSNILRISRQIAVEMENQYTLSFYPSRPPDGRWHTLRVGLRGVAGSKDFVLTYRQGYQAAPVRKAN